MLLASGLILTAPAAEMQWIGISDDGQGFALSDSGKPFIPWGFNYDREGDGQLLEDYRDDRWPKVESGFVPERIAEELDFIAFHIYPETGKLDEAMVTLHGFAAAAIRW